MGFQPTGSVMNPTLHVGRRVFLLVLWGLVALVLLAGLKWPLAGLSPPGELLDPLDGLYRTARHAEHTASQALTLDALDASVTVVRDERGVPHIFAENDRDAVVALGYVVAQDRLFQLDFLPRVASGRLSEVFGQASINADRFLRSTGMDWAARKIADRIRQQEGPERDIIAWFAAGANAYIDALDEKDLPFEFRLFGYRPERYSSLHAVRLMQYFAYDLTYYTDAAYYSILQERLDAKDYATLYPRHASLYVPIIPERGGGATPRMTDHASLSGDGLAVPDGRSTLTTSARRQQRLLGTWGEGVVPGKGSNNWAVAGTRSTTGAPILAGDPHLSMTLPSIWYEVHLVTPTMNIYGVTPPGSPVLINAFNDYVAWSLTNTGADVIDHYALELDQTGARYRFEEGWRDLDVVLDTIVVKGRAPVVDTLYYAHWGPVVIDDSSAVATRWVAHEAGHTLQAFWEMSHARNTGEFQTALQRWDTPMQNIIYADVAGNISIRATGYLPVRKAGHGIGLLDGSTTAFDWVGRVPFDELPHSINPDQGFLTSSNQQPADSTYPYYLGHDWRSSYRSLRIDTLLRGKAKHTIDDFKGYQADVHAVQRDLFVPLLDTLRGLSPKADTLRHLLASWTGETTVDRAEPLVLDEWLQTLRALAWDEPAFEGVRRPSESVLYGLLRHEPDASWLDVQATESREDAAGLLRLALEATADTLTTRYGWDVEAWRWGDHHKVVFRHLTQTAALRSLWRGPLEYPGFASTLSPAGARTTTHSASWRMVVDFSQSPPVGYGVYPGGQSGNPFSVFYDLHVPTYLAFDYYDLLKPASPDELDPDRVSSRLTLRP